ncbi:hypothetical protein TWF569_010946 [Orbilia oligospora]|uniref:DNA-directed RNA polymerase III subunit RPC9 n=1 Tax=Orbilia oligospora TaxID=2813651 RepID=A0A7C8JI60_ORBOL|nr:hypothetical protein TWF103_003650 [Orbilia oligospora]KAF3089496.1 hypothetical protein TWF706_010365 [Orbilia oligospora]KAF3110457.1 hypothetical protein TWF102_008043 [Orbilia oligospora]KAF3119451.1 hypothetical protein TWF703_003327 [Orbilia oligospora]KAF3121411.1 hypothetical protein TWF594_003214 [Orbilia oligospora]
MKILEPCEAMLSNYEVLAHIQEVKQRYRNQVTDQGPAAAMKPGNLETVMKEVIDYLSTTAAIAQTPEATTKLVEDLAKSPLQFEKIEVLMILNHLPKNETELDVLIEELESRLSEEQITKVLDTILSATRPKADHDTLEG